MVDREAFLDRKKALEAQGGHWYSYHFRDFTLEWDEEFCFSNDLEVQTFDHFTFEDALGSLDRQLKDNQE